MLDTLDILVGFTLVMLIMSMAVTMLTQLIGSALLNLRGQALRIGTSRLLTLLDRGLTVREARAIADHILRNPLVGQPRVFNEAHRIASIVHREELIKLLLDFAAGGEADRASNQEVVNIDDLRHKLRRSLRDNGIDDPAAILEQVRNAVLELERTSPELSHSMRLNMAILTFAASEFLSKLNSWFDQTIDRVSEIFTSRTRIVTAAVSIVLAFVLQLDAISLINRLSVDDELRDRLVASAIERVERTEAEATTDAAGEKIEAPPVQAADVGIGNEAATAAEPDEAGAELRRRLDAIRDSGLDDLEGYGLVSFPRSFDEWVDRWTINEPGRDAELSIFMRLFGILLTAAVLSLGAPFWYSALRDLVKLRSTIARKDDAERAERQTSQAPPAGSTTVPPQYRGGEAGDLEPAG